MQLQALNSNLHNYLKFCAADAAKESFVVLWCLKSCADI